MTTIIATPNYLIADNRCTYNFIEENTFSIKDNVININEKITIEQFADKHIKIFLMQEDEVFKIGNMTLVAWAFSGESDKTIKTVKDAINETKYSGIFDFLVSYLLGFSESCIAEIVFYFNNGNCFYLNLVRKISRVYNNDYCLVLGSGCAGIDNLNLTVKIEAFHPRDLFALAFVSDKRTSHTYSVFGRKENMFYPLVDEGLDNIKQIGLTLRDKYSITFDPNNAF